jgi:hypothetical protein
MNNTILPGPCLPPTLREFAAELERIAASLSHLAKHASEHERMLELISGSLRSNVSLLRAIASLRAGSDWQRLSKSPRYGSRNPASSGPERYRDGM